MPLESANITFDLADQLGVDFDPRRTKVWITTNVPSDTVIDTSGNKIRLGSGNVTVNPDGTGQIDVWKTGQTGLNPLSWQTTVHVDYPDRNARGGRGRRDFGPFTITSSVDLTDLIAEQEIPPTYVGAVMGQLDAKVDEASAFADAAAASAAQAQSVADIDTPDALVATLVPTSSGSATSAALSATIAAVVPGEVADALAEDDTPALAAASAVGTALNNRGIPEPPVLARNEIKDPFLNVSGSWTTTIQANKDWTGPGLRMTNNGTTAFYVQQNDGGFATTPGKTITLAATVKRVAGTGSGYVMLRFWASAGPSTIGSPISAPSTTAVALTGSDQRLTLSQVVPAGADRVAIRVGFSSVSADFAVDITDPILNDTGRTDALNDNTERARWTGTVDASATELLDAVVFDSQAGGRITRELPWQNVKWHGAKGDGVTNDTAAFHAAIAALPASGGTVFVPEGIYIAAVRVKKANVTLAGNGWNSIIKTQPNAVALDTDCPIRLLADYCTVRDLATDGNRANNPALDVSSAAARTADGVAIYANYCRVSRVKTDDHQGHHLIAWNDAFPAESIPVGARHDNVIEDCLSVRPGIRNTLDFASTQDVGVGAGYDQNINYRNTFVGCTVIGAGACIIIHTGWDSIIERCTVVDTSTTGGGGITVHTGSRRVTVRGNTIIDGALRLYGGLDTAYTEAERRSRNISATDNLVRRSSAIAGGSAVHVKAVDGSVVARNHLEADAGSYVLWGEANTGTDVTANVIKGSGTGVRLDALTTASGAAVRGNRMTGQTTRGVNITGVSDCEVVDNITEKWIEVSAPGATIRGNRVTAGGTYAIVLNASSTGALVTGNRLTATTPVTGAPAGTPVVANILNGTWTP